MPESSQPRTKPVQGRRIRLATGLLFTLAVVLVILAVLWAALPQLARNILVPAVAAKLGLSQLDVEVRRADLTGLDLGAISLGPDAGIRMDAVQADWSPAGILKGRVDRVRIMGLRIAAVEEDGRWSVRGLPAMEETDGDGPVFIPEIGDMAVEGRLKLEGREFALQAPFSLDGSLEKSGRMSVKARTELAGQQMRLSLTADLRRKDVRLTCTLPPASVAALASLVPGLRGVPVNGSVAARAHAELPADGRPRLQADLGLESVRALLGGSPAGLDGNASMRLDWQDAPRLELDPLRLNAPLPLALTVRDITLDPKAQALNCAWDLFLPELPGLALAAPMNVNGTTAVRRTPSGWKLHARGALAPLAFGIPELPELKAALEGSPFTLDVSTDQAATRVAASVSPGRLRAHLGDMKYVLSGSKLVCNATTESDGTRGSFALSGARLDAAQPGLVLNTTRLQADGAFELGPHPVLDATVRTGLVVRSGEASAAASVNLPLAWPVPSAAAGRVAVDVNWNRKPLAKFSCRVAQNLRGASVKGFLEVVPLGVRASVKGTFDAFRSRDSWAEAAVEQEIALPGGLAAFAPALADLVGSARLEGSARLDMNRGVPIVPARLKLADLALTHAKTRADLRGGSLGIAFGDLLSTRSEPDQRLTFETLQLGTVLLEKGDIRFQVEGPHSVLVEGCSFRWAGGRIGTQAFRVNPGVEDYTVEMYCDRVDLARALEQFGMTQVHGGGTANGRIPVRWADGALTFDDGFLYSTPGEKGVLRILGTEVLTAGVTPGTPQYGQLDLASEALKDFSYEWAKVTMNTEGRELIVSLQLDGKPQEPLPFVFNRDLGGFARVSASSPGSVFQGIRLDVNFRLPLDQLLQYKQLLELMNNGG